MFRLLKFLCIFTISFFCFPIDGHTKDKVFKKINPTFLSNISILDKSNQMIKTHNLFLKDETKIINFWATWCIPCKKELPELEKIREKINGKKNKIYIISIDKKKIDEQFKFLKNNKIFNLIPLFDKKMNFFNSLNLRGIPTTIILNREGYVIAKHEGILKSEVDLINEILDFIN